MKPRPALSSICRGCGHPSSAAAPNVSRSSLASKAVSQTRPTFTIGSRQLSSTPRYLAPSTANTEHPPIPEVPNLYSPKQPQPATPTQQPSSPSSEAAEWRRLSLPLTTARVTSLTSRVAHLTRSLPSHFHSVQKTYYLPQSVRAFDPTDTLRVGDIVKYSLFTPSERAAREERRRMFEDWEIEREKKDPRKKRTIVSRVREVMREREGGFKVRRKLRRGRVKYVVREVVTPFGEGMGERVRRGEMNSYEKRVLEQMQEMQLGAQVMTDETVRTEVQL